MKSDYSSTPVGEDEDEDDTKGEFAEIDHIGLYTLGVYAVLSMPLILSAVRGLGYVFTAGKVNYRCLVTECENPSNTTLYPTWLSNAVPYVNADPDTCTRYIVLNATDSCSTTLFSKESERCDAWIYDPEESTILNEWNLTCDNNLWKLTLPGTMGNIGQFVGLVISGHLSDKYGRRMLLVVCTTLSSILGLIRSYSVNYEMFVTFEFLDSLAGSAVYSAAFVLAMEYVGPKKRVLASVIIACMYVVYAMFLGLFAMWLRSWRLLLRVFYTPGLFAILLPCVVPESVRWLLKKGRAKEAEAVLRQIAAGNKIEISERSITLIRTWENEESTNDTEVNTPSISPVRAVIGNRTILIRLMICICCWVANDFVYYGLSLRSVEVPGNKYINFILVAAVEIPANIAAWILADHLGRKKTLSISYLLSGIFCIITIFVPAEWWYMPLIVFLGGKFSIAVAYHLIYVVTTEMFPTELRHSLLTVCSMVGRVGSMSAPQTPLLANYMPSLPLLLFGTIAMLSSLLSLNFPETLGVKLPDTVCEAANIGKVEKESEKDEQEQNNEMKYKGEKEKTSASLVA